MGKMNKGVWIIIIWVSVFMVTTSSVEGRVARGITQQQCQAEIGHLLKIIEEWGRKNHQQISTSEKPFWNTIFSVNGWASKVPYALVHYKLANYFKMEDGAVPSIRTGREERLYWSIKYFALHAPLNKKLTLGHMIWMGLNACNDGSGRANLPLVLLTIHNVVRALARPEQWNGPPMPGDYGHPPTDPMYPIFKDLLGKRGGSLPEIMNRRGFRLRIGRNGVVARNWSRGLFDQRVGLFQTLTGARNAMWNGGCHYYFWIGSAARMLLGSSVVIGGAFNEMHAKSGLGDKDQGAVEISHFICGAALSANALKRYNKKTRPPICPHPPGNFCKGHQLFCRRNGRVYSFPRSAIDRNLDNRCDICGKPYLTKERKLAPGLYSAQRGDVFCKKRPW